VVYAETMASSEDARSRERQIKRWTTRKKEALIAGDQKSLRILSQRRRY